MTADLNAAIDDALRQALERLGAQPAELHGLDWRDNGAVTALAQSLVAPFELLCTIGSRSDTLSDQDVLRHLHSFNERGTIYRRVIAEIR